MIAFIVGIHDGAGLAAADGSCRIDQVQRLQVRRVIRQCAAEFINCYASFEVEAGQHVKHGITPRY